MRSLQQRGVLAIATGDPSCGRLSETCQGIQTWLLLHRTAHSWSGGRPGLCLGDWFGKVLDEHYDILCERMRCEIKIQNATDFPELVGTKHVKQWSFHFLFCWCPLTHLVGLMMPLNCHHPYLSSRRGWGWWVDTRSGGTIAGAFAERLGHNIDKDKSWIGSNVV